MNRLRAFLLVLPCLVAAACGDLPQPFEHGRRATAYPLATLTLDVRVAPVAGLPAEAAGGLAQAMAEALGGHGITATHRGGVPSRFVLTGEVAAAGGDPDRVLVTWTLRDADGAETGLHSQELRAAWTDWQPLDMGLMRAFAAAPAKAVAALVGVDAALPPAAEPAGEVLYVAGVEGAPGDGNAALAAAMSRELKLAGLEVTDDPGAADLVLRATVAVGPAERGQQPVSLVWAVANPDGSAIGEAAQENAVAAGSLDGRWGPVAGYAAAAALDGIRDILDRRKAKATPSGIVIPGTPDLPPPVRPATDDGPEKAGNGPK